MNILCIADHVDNLVYNAHFKKHFNDIDLVISAGDLPMNYLGFIASSSCVPVLFVFGNHNLQHMDLFMKRAFSFLPKPHELDFPHRFGATYIGDKVYKIKKYIFVGLGGSKRYNNGKNQFSELHMTWRIIRLIPRLLWNKLIHGRYLDIFVTHAAPYGINDRKDKCHEGFKCFLWFIRKFRPRYHLHGHIHLYDINSRRIAKHEGTEIINVFNHYLLKA